MESQQSKRGWEQKSATQDLDQRERKELAEKRLQEADAKRDAAKAAREIRRKEENQISFSMPFFNKKDDPVKLTEPPAGVPSILSWTQRPDGE